MGQMRNTHIIFIGKPCNYLCIGIALGYGLDDSGSKVRFLVGAGNFSLHHRVQNSSGDHPVSYPMGSRGSIPGDKETGA
jgi:hypothetical protein